MSVVRGVLRSIVGEATGRRVEESEHPELSSEGAAEGVWPEAGYAFEDARPDEVVRLVREAIPNASVEAIRGYARLLDDRKQAARRMAEHSVIERLPDPKPATLGQRLGSTPEVLAEEIVDALRHESY